MMNIYSLAVIFSFTIIFFIAVDTVRQRSHERIKEDFEYESRSIAQNYVNKKNTQDAKSNVIVREREVIKIRCRYCGYLVDQGLDKCPNCGAKT